MTNGVASDGEEPANLRLGIVPNARGVVIDIGGVGECLLSAKCFREKMAVSAFFIWWFLAVSAKCLCFSSRRQVASAI